MSGSAAPATAGGEEEEPIVISSSPSSSGDESRGASDLPKRGGGLCSRLRSSKKTEKHREVEEEGNAGVGEEEEEEEVEGEEANGVVKGSRSSSVVFPVRRVRVLMTECEDCRPSHESVFLLNKAAELFLEAFVSDAYKKGHKSVTYKNLSSVVSAKKKYQFLSDYVPEKIKAEDALKARASLES